MNHYRILVDAGDGATMPINPGERDIVTLDQVPATITGFLDRYTRQGYYLNCQQDRVDLDEISFILEAAEAPRPGPASEEEMDDEQALAAAKQKLPQTPFVSLAPEPLAAGWIPWGKPMAQRVADQLRSVGVDASYEFPPGFVQITATNDTVWNFGTANENWGGDHATSDGANIGYMELPIRSVDRSDGRAIAVAICAAMIVDALTPEQIAYATHRSGFASMHDFCDANILLPGIEHYDASNDYLGDFCTEVQHAINDILSFK